MSSRELERLLFIVFWIINGKLKMAARQVEWVGPYFT